MCAVCVCVSHYVARNGENNVLQTQSSLQALTLQGTANTMGLHTRKAPRASMLNQTHGKPT